MAAVALSQGALPLKMKAIQLISGALQSSWIECQLTTKVTPLIMAAVSLTQGALQLTMKAIQLTSGHFNLPGPNVNLQRM
jgi:hypothetical protein